VAWAVRVNRQSCAVRSVDTCRFFVIKRRLL